MPSSAAVQVASGGDDTSSEAGGGARWVAHRWGVSVCEPGAAAVRSGCVLQLPALQRIDAVMTTIVNDRGIAMANDTHAFDLHELAPVLEGGWVLLGDLDRYVSVSSKRFLSVGSASAAAGLSMDVVGVADETLYITALRPAARRGSGDIAEWTVVAKEIRFSSGCTSVPVAGQTAPACVQHVVLH